MTGDRAARVCARCGAGFTADSRREGTKRFCSRRCQMNDYHARRLATDEAFHQRALEYQRLWRVRERARQQTTAALSEEQAA